MTGTQDITQKVTSLVVSEDPKGANPRSAATPQEFVQPQPIQVGTALPVSEELATYGYILPDKNGDNLPKLFRPVKFRDLTLPNRIIVAPLCQYSAEDGYPTDWHFVHLGSLATRGAGLVIVEATGVLPNGRITPHCLGLWKDDHIPSFERIVKYAHSQGTAIGIQLAHAGRKASCNTPFTSRETADIAVSAENGGWLDNVWGPTNESFKPDVYPTPQAMSLDQIQQVKDAFVAAARRADQAGFDVVEIHAAHGYLLHSFLSPLTNTRTDRYGGADNFDNRARLLLETVEAVRNVWPQGKPLFVRISATDWVEGEGIDGEHTVELARRLHALGIDLLDVSTGGLTPRQKITAKPLYQVPYSAQVKRAVPDLATSAVGIIRDGKDAEEVLQKGEADLIAIGRPFLSNTSWALEAAAQLGVYVKWPQQYERARPKLRLIAPL
ncbi:hypothetical protein IWQ60_011519 [Tieghemiomyces parasiticus]|uniref:NADH:flavin oxidoreductase/NADH oxidase N-terminal domain-containing protein n=1 Tax=Tieghemiomyces parasiticus TaxID=78921 RepID=A0A9W8DM71_9FUNG|nr:hypothetical protein IWQ60_011519 [Tieghemiomyces parasiticus]